MSDQVSVPGGIAGETATEAVRGPDRGPGPALRGDLRCCDERDLVGPAVAGLLLVGLDVHGDGTGGRREGEGFRRERRTRR